MLAYWKTILIVFHLIGVIVLGVFTASQKFYEQYPNIMGNDKYVPLNAPVGATTVDACKNICNVDVDCAGFSFNPTSKTAVFYRDTLIPKVNNDPALEKTAILYSKHFGSSFA